jgi:outer membrane protein, multidrug efflux system
MRRPIIMRRPVALLGILLAAGCSLAPTYERPAAPVAVAWPEDAAPGDRAPAELDWRAYFTDGQLQSLISMALESNRDMVLAVARVAEARAQFGIVNADRVPTVDAVASRSEARTPADLSSSGRATTTQRYDVNLGVTAFELDFWGRVASLSESARASYLATEEAQRAFHLSLISDVASAYFALLEAEERLSIARETRSSREESFRLIARRRDVGLAGDLDYLAGEGALQSARAEQASLERQRSAAANALTLLIGRPLNGIDVSGRKLADQGMVSDLAAGLPSEVLTKRPDILVAEQRLIAANANIGAARAAFLPRISLTAALGTASRTLSGLFDDGSGAWSFVPVLRLPLFDAGRLAANVDLAEARKVIAVAEYEKAIQQAFREVADLLSAREKLSAQLKAQEAAERAQTERLRIVEARYGAGISSYLEVLDAQRELFAVQQSVVATRRTWLAAAAQLYKALGGGGRVTAAS